MVLQIAIVRMAAPPDSNIPKRQNVLLELSDELINADGHFFVFGFSTTVVVIFVFKPHRVALSVIFELINQISWLCAAFIAIDYLWYGYNGFYT